MIIQGYTLFNAETGEMVPPLESTGSPIGMLFDRLIDAQDSASEHEEGYGITCDIRVCTIEVHGS